MKVKELFTKVMTFADDHQREILLGCTIVGIISTGVTAWRNAPKAKTILEEHKKVMEEIPEDDVAARKQETFDTVKEMAPLVLPPVVLGAATIACAVGGHSASSKQIAALSAAYSMAEKSLSDYTEKAKELLGDKKVTEIKDEVAADKVRKNPPKGEEAVFNTGHGNMLWLDDYSGRYFYSDPEYIRKVVNDINEQLRDEFYVSLNDFYERLGLPNCKLGSDIGFCMEDGNLNVSFSYTGATIGDKDNIPCGVLNYDVSPKYGFGDFSGRFNR